MLTTFLANDVRQTLDQFRRSVGHMFDNLYGQSQPSASNASGERSWTLGERKTPEGFEKNASTQLAYGAFYAALTLPAGLDLDHVHCRLHNGILEMQVPILETSKPKQIRIQTAEERKAINA